METGKDRKGETENMLLKKRLFKMQIYMSSGTLQSG